MSARVRARFAAALPLLARVALGVSVAVTSTLARADDMTNTRQARAQALFEEGRRLMEEEKFPEACAAFAESQNLDPGGGTLLNLASCHERIGKTATAWVEFCEALSVAVRDGRAAREKTARERIEYLRPRLLRFGVLPSSSTDTAGLVIKIDGLEIGKAGWGILAPADPGAHVIEATAPNRTAWSTTVTLDETSSGLKVEVPPLAPAPAPREAPIAAPAAPAPERASEADRGRRLDLWLLAIGGVSLAAGTASGIMMLTKRHESDLLCQGGDSKCTLEGAALNQQAITYSWVSTVAFGIGLVTSGAGGYLLLRRRPHASAPSGAATPPRGVRWSASGGAGSIGVSLDGAF